jgi:mRNA-degrading endonuclease RelE of RelBE toxin-antitoxin system
VANSTTYRIVLKREARRALQSIPRHIAQQAQTFIDAHLQHSPTQRIPSKMKRLKGQLSGVWPYDMPSGYRLWYRANDQTRTVEVIYIGPHP